MPSSFIGLFCLCIRSLLTSCILHMMYTSIAHIDIVRIKRTGVLICVHNMWMLNYSTTLSSPVKSLSLSLTHTHTYTQLARPLLPPRGRGARR